MPVMRMSVSITRMAFMASVIGEPGGFVVDGGLSGFLPIGLIRVITGGRLTVVEFVQWA